MFTEKSAISPKCTSGDCTVNVDKDIYKLSNHRNVTYVVTLHSFSETETETVIRSLYRLKEKEKSTSEIEIYYTEECGNDIKIYILGDSFLDLRFHYEKLVNNNEDDSESGLDVVLYGTYKHKTIYIDNYKFSDIYIDL